MYLSLYNSYKATSRSHWHCGISTVLHNTNSKIQLAPSIPQETEAPTLIQTHSSEWAGQNPELKLKGRKTELNWSREEKGQTKEFAIAQSFAQGTSADFSIFLRKAEKQWDTIIRKQDQVLQELDYPSILQSCKSLCALF